METARRQFDGRALPIRVASLRAGYIGNAAALERFVLDTVGLSEP
jgi:hypothetical protein